jgi:hypothetical protein
MTTQYRLQLNMRLHMHTHTHEHRLALVVVVVVTTSTCAHYRYAPSFANGLVIAIAIGILEPRMRMSIMFRIGRSFVLLCSASCSQWLQLGLNVVVLGSGGDVNCPV